MAEIDIDEVRMWARASGAIATHYFHGTTARSKADRSLVTQADVEIERFLRERIATRYPDHGIMGEEGGVGQVEREYVWALDPLDGTAAFVAGLPIWGVSIGLLRHGQPLLGVIYMPLVDECYWAIAGEGAFCNDRPIAAREGADLDSNDWIAGPSKMHLNYSITFPGKVRALGSIAAYFCYVARGSAVGALLGRPHLWDIAAGMVLLHEAGGLTVGLSGQPIDLAPMLRGEASTERIILSARDMLPQLIGSITPRARLTSDH